MNIVLIRRLIVTGVIFSSVLFCSLQQANCQDISVTLIPDDVEVLPLQDFQTTVLLDNKKDQPIKDVRLSWLTDANLSISASEENVSQIGPKAQHVWVMHVVSKSLDTRNLHVRVRLNYRTESGVQQIIVKTLTLRPYQFKPISTLAGLQVKTSLVSLSQQRPGEIYLIVTNKSSLDLEVTALQPKTPAFIRCDIDSTSHHLPAGQSDVLTIPVRAADRVQPGKHLLLFEVNCLWNDAGMRRIATLYETKEIEVGVLGESEILKLLGVPSFLVLPGFLLIVTINLVWKIGKKKQSAEEFPLKANTSEFWLVAITYSIIAALVYPRLGISQGYWDTYGLQDVISVWLGSIVLGVFGYLTYAAGKNLWARWKAKKQKMIIVSGDDTPLEVLRKLSRRDLTVCVDTVEVKDGAETFVAYLLEPRSENAASYCIGPPIQIVKKSAEATALVLVKSQIEAELKEKGNAERLADIIEEGKKQGLVDIKWGAAKSLTRPKQVGRDLLKFREQKDIIATWA